MAEIGLQLKRAREGLGLSLSDMQRLTKIHIEYLRALEEDQFDTLPSPFYVRAFLRTYAASVGLDPKPLLDRYEWLAAGGVPSTPRHLSKEGSLRRPMRSEPRGGRTTPPGRTYSQQMPPSSNLSANQEGLRAPMLNPLEGQSGHQGRSPRVDEPRSLFPSNPELARSQSRQRYMPQAAVEQTLPREEEQPKVPSSPVSPETESLSTTMMESTSSTGRLPATRLPDTSSLDKPLAPRRTLEASRSSRGKSGSKWMIGTAAVGALLLVSATAFYFFNSRAEGDKPSQSQAVSVASDEQEIPTGSGGSSVAVAEKTEKPKLALLKSGSDLEGDLYELAGSDKIEVIIKAKKGSCSLRYSEKTGGDGENYTLKVGDQKKITVNGDFIWFRLGTPSNVEILVNGESIDTLAQDVAKSYRIQVKK